jgi:hypothetical protein
MALSEVGKAKRKQRRAKSMMGLSGLVGLMPIFEFIDRHDAWSDLATTHAVASLGPIVVGAIGILWASRIHSEGKFEQTQSERTDTNWTFDERGR